MNPERLDINDEYYPRCLRETGYDSNLWYKGTFQVKDKNAIAILGTRECTRYGRKVVRSLVKYLTKNDVTIVSGLAYGIDECVIRTTIAEKGRCIGFLGFSFITLERNLDDLNTALINVVENYKNSVIISALETKDLPSRNTYLLRNHILASFCEAIVIVEAGLNSVLHKVVDSALDYGKEVFVVPGSIFSDKSAGVHKMIDEGARVLLNYSDLIIS